MSSNTMRGVLLAVLLVAVVGLSVVAGAGAGGGTPASDAPRPLAVHNDTPANATEPADEIHISEDGEVVMVYENDTTGDITETEFGIDVATGLANAMFVSDQDASGVSGNLSTILSPDNVSGAGDAVITETGNLTALDASANLTQTNAESSFDASLVAATDTGASGLGSFETNGSVVLASNEFRMDANVSSGQALFLSRNVETGVTIQGIDTGYTVSAEEVRPGANETQWGTEQAANETLNAQFSTVADRFNGSSEVTINAHSYDNASGTLDINYTVVLTDVKTGIANSVVSQVSSDPRVELGDEERAELVDALRNVSVEEIDLQENRTGETNPVTASVRISNYQEAVIALMEISANRSESLTEADIDRYRETVDAREAANLIQETTWDVDINGSTESTEIALAVGSTSQNWTAYVSELEERGIERSAAVSATMSAELTGDSIDVEGNFELQRDDLIGDALSALEAEANSTEDDPTVGLLQALQDSEFDTARGDISLAEGTVTLQAGASFDNVSALQNAVGEVVGDTAVTGMYGQGDANSSATYVYLGDTHNLSELERRGLVGNDTEVVEDSDISRFPRMNTTAAAQYLGVETTPGDGDNETATPTPTTTPGDGDNETATATPTTPGDGDNETATPTPTTPGDGDNETATPTPTTAPGDPGNETMTPTTAPGDGTTTTSGQPGFGTVVAALAVVLAGLFIARRR